ncbi:CD320 antigen [Rhineura floridana]|uniref:CD320 antigen n=1 Tax=Rhineura floridana TaxID=261503 RepID=UPI002AC8560F|nr:CD320 antigen [Rhineura floridana]
MERLFLASLLLTAAGRVRASDAESFLCTIGSFQCESDGAQVPLCLRCDGKADCSDESDENGCQAGTVSCGRHGRQCGSGGPCLPLERICDGRSNCPDGSDESLDACGPQLAWTLPACRKEEFRCAPGTECFPLTWVCDGHSDCLDKRDELGCGLESPVIPQTTQTDGEAVPGNVMPEDLMLLAVVALLAIVVAAVCILVWRNAKMNHLTSNGRCEGSEQLVLKQQP